MRDKESGATMKRVRTGLALLALPLLWACSAADGAQPDGRPADTSPTDAAVDGAAPVDGARDRAVVDAPRADGPRADGRLRDAGLADAALDGVKADGSGIDASAGDVSTKSVEVYPAVPARQSALWKVEVWDGAQWLDAHALQYTRLSIDPAYHGGFSPWVHWVTIGASGSVQVRVSRLTRSWGENTLTSAAVHPLRYGITPTVDLPNKVLTFTIAVNQKVYVETNGQDRDTLFIFANPFKPPYTPAPNIEYFGPGVHTIGRDYRPKASTDTLYLDGGAWVEGSINVTATRPGSSTFRIIGPGILSGGFDTYENVLALGSYAAKFPSMLIHTDYAPPGPLPHGLLVDGITLVASPSFNFGVGRLQGQKVLRHVHILSPWTYNTDGFSVGSRVDIRHCLVFNNDDTVHAEYVNGGPIDVIDSVFAGRNAYLIGYGYFAGGKTAYATMERNDLVLQNKRIPFRARIDANPSKAVVVENQIYRDIVIHGSVERLFHLNVERTAWGFSQGVASTPVYGNAAGLLFDNIRLEGVQSSKSQIHGENASNTIGSALRPIIFRNLRMGGTLVTNANYTSYFDVNAFAYVDFQ